MDGQMATETSVWVVLVTDGTVVAYPPEIYRSMTRAVSESERWAWLLSGEGLLEVERPFEGRWRVADRDIRLIEARLRESLASTPWVATYWTRNGAPDPEAVVMSEELGARARVRKPPAAGLEIPRIFETPWSSAAIYVVHGEEEYAVVHLAKVVA